MSPFQLQRDNKWKILTANLLIWKKNEFAPLEVMRAYRVEGTTSLFLNLGTRWRWMVSFTLRPLISEERAAGTP
jgi:hypothetical protein